MLRTLARLFSAACITILIGGYAHPQDASEHFKRGEQALAAREYDRAVLEFTQHLQQKPDSSAAYFNRALAYRALDNKALAIDDLTKAIERRTGFARAYNTRGSTYAGLGQDDFAVADFTKAIELEPANPVFYVNRAEVYKKRRQLDEARADLDRALQRDDKNAKAYFIRGDIHTIQASWPQAAADMRTALRLDPAQSGLYHPLAWLEMHVGNDGAAHESAAKFLDAKGMKHERSGWTLVAGYLALLRAGKRDEAERFIGQYPRAEAAGVMPKKALEYLRGDLQEGDLLSEAGDDPIKRTDARSIIGLRNLLEGKNEEALKQFSWVKDNGKRSPTTYALAMVELARLTSAKTTPMQR